MRKTTYKARSGRTMFRPVFNKEFERLAFEGNYGFCLACGEEAEGVEPDARGYTCSSCEEPKVYGLEELVLMGLAR